ncbi:MAG: flippase [Candidatus Acidiferrales bacterium]
MRDPVTILGRVLLGNEESDSIRTRLVVGLSGLVGLRVAFGVLAFGLTILLARVLGTQGFGAYSYALAWTVLLGVPAILGTDQLLIREIAAYQVKSQWALMRGLLRRANAAVLLASLGIAVAAVVVAWAMRSRWPRQELSTFCVALLLLPLIALTRVRQAALQGLHRVVLGSTPERLIQPALLLAFVLLAYWSRNGALSAPVAMALNVLATGVAFAIGALWLHRALPTAVRETMPEYRSREWARSALPLVFLAGMGVLFGQAGILTVGAIKGASAVGIYSIAEKVSELLTFVLVAQNTAFSSTAASLYAAGDLARLQRLATRIARITLLASLPLAILFIGFGHWFLLYCYGAQYVHAARALAILSVGQLVNIGMGLNSVLLMMTGHERDAATAIAVSAIFNIGLNLLLVPRWGLEGAAISTASSLVLLNVLSTSALRRKTGIHSTVIGAVRPA